MLNSNHTKNNTKQKENQKKKNSKTTTNLIATDLTADSVIEDLPTGYKVLIEDITLIKKHATKFFEAISTYGGTSSESIALNYRSVIERSTGETIELLEIDYYVATANEKTPELVALAEQLNTLTAYDFGFRTLAPKDNRTNLTPNLGG